MTDGPRVQSVPFKYFRPKSIQKAIRVYSTRPWLFDAHKAGLDMPLESRSFHRMSAYAWLSASVNI